MTHYRLQMFREKLENFTISDYHGLQSPGLTCYLNSVLQVLFMTEDFRGSMKRRCSGDSTTIDTLLRKLFADLERSLAKTHKIVKKLGITDVYEQRDAAEYFEKILCLTSPEASKIFKGELNNKITCVECKKKNDSRSFFWILPLAMKNSCGQTYSVRSGLEAFFKTQKVYSDNKMYCSRCNKKQDADIDCEMTQNPEVLTLLLKRFTFDCKRRCYVKLHCKVDAPQTLHVKSCKYELYALVHHLGNLTGGHYTAEIKSFETGEWYRFNDEIVKMVGEPLFVSGNTLVRSCTAYLLMYRKERTYSEKADEVDQEFQCSLSHDEAGRGQALVHHQLKDESCNGDEKWKYLNGDKLKKSYDDTVWKQRTDSSGEQDFSKVQKDGGRREPHRQIESNSEHVASGVNSMSAQNHISQQKSLKPNDISWDRTGPDSAVTTTATKTKRVTDRSPTRSRAKPAETGGTEADVSVNVADYAVNSFHMRHSHSNCRINESTGCCFSPSQCRNSSNSKRSKEKSPRKTKDTKRSKETVK